MIDSYKLFRVVLQLWKIIFLVGRFEHGNGDINMFSLDEGSDTRSVWKECGVRVESSGEMLSRHLLTT